MGKTLGRIRREKAGHEIAALNGDRGIWNCVSRSNNTICALLRWNVKPVKLAPPVPPDWAQPPP